jgi:hypothetical protein
VAASGPPGPIQFYDLLGMCLQEPGQAGAIATGALDRPHSSTILSVSEPQQLPVAGRGCRHGRLVDHRAADRLDDRRGVGVLVGVDPDDELDNLCQHSHALTPCPDVDVDGIGPDRRTAGL